MNKTTLNPAMIDALTICHALDSAAQMLAIHDGESNWAAWVRYFLETLEHMVASCEAYEAFLRSLQCDITIRLEQGQW